METALIVIVVLAVVAFLVWYFLLRTPQEGGVIRLPLELLDLKNIPGVPFSIEATVQTAVSLAERAKETTQALNGLQKIFTIQKETANARAFLFGRKDNPDHQRAREEVIKEMARSRHAHFKDPARLKRRLSRHTVLDWKTDTGTLTQLFLDRPEQFSLSWTTFAGVYDKAEPRLHEFAQTLEVTPKGAEAATAAFWPTIANSGMAFNLLLPLKLGPAEAGHPYAGKTIYRIDLRLFESFASSSTDGFDRFTPGVVIELYQEPESLNLLPYQIEVVGFKGAPSKIYVKSDATPALWLYALQAAKTAVTVWGIWVGHVYHWHMVPAALQLTLYTTESLTGDHPVRRLLDPMSNYLIGFDDFLLLAYEQIAPPTSFKTPLDFLELQNFFAQGRNYHDDDPIPTLHRLNIDIRDFSTDAKHAPWDKYILVKYLLDLWNATEAYVTDYVGRCWPVDAAVIDDGPLHAWLRASSSPTGGNINGLPALDGAGAQGDLIRLLTSYLYRITAHGSSRMNIAANPVQTFVANFPPCLQSTDPPSASMDTEDLLRFLPNTGTLGSMVTFLFTFAFSAPSESFIPAKGVAEDLFFPGDETAPLNAALIRYREAVEKVLREYDKESQQIHQWPRNVET